MKNNESKKKGIMTRTRGERLGMKGRKNFEKEKKKTLLSLRPQAKYSGAPTAVFNCLFYLLSVILHLFH